MMQLRDIMASGEHDPTTCHDSILALEATTWPANDSVNQQFSPYTLLGQIFRPMGLGRETLNRFCISLREPHWADLAFLGENNYSCKAPSWPTFHGLSTRVGVRRRRQVILAVLTWTQHITTLSIEYVLGTCDAQDSFSRR